MNNVYLILILLIPCWIISALILKKDIVIFTIHKNQSAKLLTYTPLILAGFLLIALKPFDAIGDTPRYLLSFSRLTNPFTATDDASYGSEVFFWPLQAFIKFFVSIDYWFTAHFIIISILNYYAYRKITEKTNINPLVFLLLYLTYFTVYDANAMRQSYSIPIAAIAFCYAYEKNYLKYFIFSLISISFHWSAVIIILAPIFSLLPSKRYLYFTLPIISLAAAELLALTLDAFVSLTGFTWLASKHSAYILGNYSSHLTSIWESINFWSCILIYYALALTNPFKSSEEIKIINFLFRSRNWQSTFSIF